MKRSLVLAIAVLLTGAQAGLLPAQTLQLDYSTYLGGSSQDVGYAIAVDSDNYAYVTGQTQSTNFPTGNAYQASTGGGTTDAFVSKLSSAGTSLVYSTYLGGNSNDDGYGIAVDSAYCAYVTGYASSNNFPTMNPYQADLNAIRNAFVTKLSSSGSSLVYSTYLGGSSVDYGKDISLDSVGSAYVTGQTNSTNFPTLNPYQAARPGTTNSPFVSKLSSSGSSLLYSTYLGGSDWDDG